MDGRSAVFFFWLPNMLCSRRYDIASTGEPRATLAMVSVISYDSFNVEPLLPVPHVKCSNKCQHLRFEDRGGCRRKFVAMSLSCAACRHHDCRNTVSPV